MADLKQFDFDEKRMLQGCFYGQFENFLISYFVEHLCTAPPEDVLSNWFQYLFSYFSWPDQPTEDQQNI